jgi:DNA repair protein RadC
MGRDPGAVVHSSSPARGDGRLGVTHPAPPTIRSRAVSVAPTPTVPPAAAVDPGGWSEGSSGGQVRVCDPGPCLTCEPRWFRPPAPAVRPEVTSPELAAQLLVPPLVAADRERCVAALLDTKHRLLELVTVSVGSLDHTFMAPREIFRDALVANAAALVLAHNHPSGDPEPSRDDELVTRRLVRAGELVGVGVLDHLVVGGERWVSLARRGVV